MTPHLLMRLHCVEPETPKLLEISGFLYDINLLNQLHQAAVDPATQGRSVSIWAIRRGSWLFRAGEPFRVRRLQYASPLLLELILTLTATAVGATIGVLEILDRLSKRKPNREKLLLEIRELKLKVKQLEDGATEERPLRLPEGSTLLDQFGRTISRALEEEELLEHVERVQRRLERSEIQIDIVDAEIIDDEDDKPR